MDERKAALKQRTKAFASAVVRFYIKLDKSREEIRVLGKQLLRSGTSVAANYQEADESQLWLELLRDDCGVQPDRVEPIWSEADELTAIFISMSLNTKTRLRRGT